MIDFLDRPFGDAAIELWNHVTVAEALSLVAVLTVAAILAEVLTAKRERR